MFKARTPITASVAALILVLVLPSARFTGAAAPLPVLISGVLRDAAEAPTTGRILLFHDNLRDNGRLELVVTARAAQDGLYELAMLPNASTTVASSNNDGHTNFAMYAVTSDGISPIRFFSGQYDIETGWRTHGDEGSDLRATLQLPSADFLEAVDELVAREEASRPTYGTAYAWDWLYHCPYSVDSSWNDWVPVFEAHSWTDLKVRFDYGVGQTADSNVSVGVKYAAKGWGLEGSIHVGNRLSTGYSEGVERWGKTGNVWSSRFTMRKYKKPWTAPSDICHGGPDWITEAHKWNPDTSGSPRVAWDDSRFDGQCTTTWAAHRNFREPGTSWERTKEKFTSFGWKVGISPFFSMTSQSGASERALLRYVAGIQNIPHYICGNNAKPMTALRVFAGH